MTLKATKSWMVNVAMVAALIGIAVVGKHFSPLLLPKADVTGIAEPGCDLQKRACRATVAGGGHLELSIGPRPIPYLQALRVEVAVTGLEARKVEVDFAGQSMNMGYNRSQLAMVSTGRYAGEASLPVCVSGSMAWMATVLVETEGQRIAVPFRFDTGR